MFDKEKMGDREGLGKIEDILYILYIYSVSYLFLADHTTWYAHTQALSIHTFRHR